MGNTPETQLRHAVTTELELEENGKFRLYLLYITGTGPIADLSRGRTKHFEIHAAANILNAGTASQTGPPIHQIRIQ
jgi:hypothetical protein